MSELIYSIHGINQYLYSHVLSSTPIHPQALPLVLAVEAIQPYFEERRADLVRFAALQLGDRSLAEDAVQETLIAALHAHRDFQHRAQLKTWVYGILKRKIIDQIRLRGRELCLSELSDDEDNNDEEMMTQLFNAMGFWRAETRPSLWVDPEESLNQQQFWRIFEACLTHLPSRTARVFMMREMLELNTEDICITLNISESNCWVILHRARLGLRHCLSHTWFDSP